MIVVSLTVRNIVMSLLLELEVEVIIALVMKPMIIMIIYYII